MNFILHIWRQKNAESLGDFVTYQVDNIDGDTSFLEMLDQLNEQLIEKGEDCICLLYTSPSPRDQRGSRMPSSA